MRRYSMILPLSFLFAGLASILLVATASAFAAAESGSGVSYYVDSQNGNDDHDGLSEATAWKSLEAVNRKTFSPGDSILLKAGSVWKGQLKPQGSGTPEKPIRIDQYSNANEVGTFKGLPRIDGEGKVDTTLLLYNVQGWEVRNLELTNEGPEVKRYRSGATIKVFDFGTAKHFVLEGLYIHDVNGHLVKGDSPDAAGQAIFLCNGGEKVKEKVQSHFDGILIQNCWIQRTQRNAIIQDGYWRRNEWLPNLNVVIRGNLIEGVPGDGIVPIGSDGALIEYNRMRDCPPTLPNGQWAAGIWPWSSDNTVIQYNEVSDLTAPGDGQAFDSDWNCQNTLIQYNFSHDNDGGFLLVCNLKKEKPEENIGNIGTVVRYNLSINDAIRGEKSDRPAYTSTIHFSGAATETQIYNNTIIIPKKAKKEMDRTLLDMGDWGGQGWAKNTYFTNNIFYVEEEADYNLGETVNTVFKNNVYYGTHNNRPADDNAITVDPKFVELVKSVGPRGAMSYKGFQDDPFLQKFRLQEDSPCIGKGVLIPDNGGKDLLGKPLGKEKCSVGAVE